jgi:hypothetical protein
MTSCKTLNLPEDVLKHIFVTLDEVDLYSACLVSKAWAILATCAVTPRTLVMLDMLIQPPALMRMLRRFGDTLHHLWLDIVTIDAPKVHAALAMLRSCEINWASLAPNVTHLSVSILVPSFRFIPCVQVFTLLGGRDYNYIKHFTHFLKTYDSCWPHLKVIGIRHRPYGQLESCNNLEEYLENLDTLESICKNRNIRIEPVSYFVTARKYLRTLAMIVRLEALDPVATLEELDAEYVPASWGASLATI